MPKIQTGLYLDRELYGRVEALAKQHKIPFNMMLTKIISEGIVNYEDNQEYLLKGDDLNKTLEDKEG